MKGVFKQSEVTLYKGKGCASCNGVGYKGRVSLVEIIEVSPALKTLIGTRPSATAVRELSKSEGGQTLFEDGIDKSRQGVTTLSEVLRVASPT